MSELDKLSLNIVYPVNCSYGVDFHPKIGQSGLYYWGREVMKGHNFPAEDISNGIWGPDFGPNCHAWRVLKTDKMDQLNSKGKFQGYSGMVYWGRKFEIKKDHHDGFWGPDNGPPWDECESELSEFS